MRNRRSIIAAAGFALLAATAPGCSSGEGDDSARTQFPDTAAVTSTTTAGDTAAVSPRAGSDTSAVASLSDWPRPRFDERAADRRRMVATQMRDIESERVLAAMRAVPRHLFVPDHLRRVAYADRPLPIGEGQTISQPYIVAYMTEKLRLEPDDRVLEIGTGSGYQAAVLNEFTPHVYTVEILESLGESAARRLAELGYETVETKIADGYYGWEQAAPFDAIIVTAAAGHVPPPLVKQLAPGGRMIVPVGGTYEVQRLILVRKDAGGEVEHESLIPVRFVPLVGHTD